MIKRSNFIDDIKADLAGLKPAVKDILGTFGDNAADIAIGAIPGMALGAGSQAYGGMRPGETEDQYRTRILRASLLGGLVGGAALPLGNFAIQNLMTAAPMAVTPASHALTFANPAISKQIAQASEDKLRRESLIGATAGFASHGAFTVAGDRALKKNIIEDLAHRKNTKLDALNTIVNDHRDLLEANANRLGINLPQRGLPRFPGGTPIYPGGIVPPLPQTGPTPLAPKIEDVVSGHAAEVAKRRKIIRTIEDKIINEDKGWRNNPYSRSIRHKPTTSVLSLLAQMAAGAAIARSDRGETLDKLQGVLSGLVGSNNGSSSLPSEVQVQP